MSDKQLRLLLDIGDVDALVEYVESLSLDERWDGLVELRDGCRAALERGHQLWPAAAYAEYRLALDGPVAYACSVLGSATERFVFGPFTEVVAQRFEFRELRDNLRAIDGPTIAALAQERVLRGDDLRADPIAVATADVFELPLITAAWEPSPSIVVYKPDAAQFPSPAWPLLQSAAVAPRGEVIDDEPVTDALVGLVQSWRASPRAHVRSVAVEGSAVDAVAALGFRDIAYAEVGVGEALGWCSWAAASGGSVSRRRGGAAARSDVWWLVRTLTDTMDDPLDPETLEERVHDLRAYVFEDATPHVGWILRVAFALDVEAVAWAVTASDALDPKLLGPK